MNMSITVDPSSELLRVLTGGGEMGALMRTIDWAQTPVGPVEGWPQSLRTVVSILLASRHPIFVWWGPELIQFYNDAYRPILGATKHPAAIGQPGRECWREIWDVIAPMIAAVMERGEATFLEDSLLALDRNGYLEECYFVYAYSPIRDETGAVGGVFVACNETTSKVLGARRMRTLRDLTNRAVQATSDYEACRRALEVLGDNPADVPFAALYLREESALVCTATIGLPEHDERFPARFNCADTQPRATAPIRAALHDDRPMVIDDLPVRYGVLPGGPWPEACHTALALPLHGSAQATPIGVLVVGLSPRLPIDDEYRGFCDLLADQLGTAIAHARAAEAERMRAAALAELDRAKTTFFSNISHEFRTPLTLLLGPVEEALANVSDPALRQRLLIVRRNALRLQKLVNMLLDFSRIEAGRLQAIYVPTDLAAFTTELAQSFRPALHQSGLRLTISCPPLAEPVYVDPDLYEKIVFNLLSNAFKFTLAGTIDVTLRDCGESVELCVRDTGVGIGPEDLGRIFERFHRVEGSRGRTHEGAGIGLALVQELVHLHGGTIRVQSELNRGSAFTVTLPKGSAHLPANRIGTARSRIRPAPNAQTVLEEMYGWSAMALPTAEPTPLSAPLTHVQTPRPRIVWAEDNADMRTFVAQLLADSFEVIAVSDGRMALEAVHTYRPDLVLSDVMMPVLDGFGLVRALREDPRTGTIPIILLSARAGEQAEIAGLEIGVDDYLTKPFSIPELLARINTHLRMAQLRQDTAEALRQSEARTRLALEVAQIGTWSVEPEQEFVLADPRCRSICGFPPEGPLDLPTALAFIHPDDLARVQAALERAFDPAGDGVYNEDYRFVHTDGSVRWVLCRGQTSFLGDGATRRPSVMIGTILDITERKAAEAALREAHAVLEARVAQRTAELQQSALQLETALAEKEVLLKEVHHRVKNNLQVIVSLLRLQSATQADPTLRDLFRDSQSRVQAMALVHEQLYQSPDLDRVPFAGYLRRLADTLLRFYLVRANQVQVIYDLDPSILLALDTAVPLGLIIAELLANSVKHAFPDERTGSIRIALQQTATALVVSISDDGVGLPNAQNPAHPTSLGLQIVATLIDQLHANIELNRAGGTHYRIAVPLTAG